MAVGKPVLIQDCLQRGADPAQIDLVWDIMQKSLAATAQSTAEAAKQGVTGTTTASPAVGVPGQLGSAAAGV